MTASLPPQSPLKAGDKFEKYEIRGLLGRGGHAFVYRAYQPFVDRHVALKLIACRPEQGQHYQRRAQNEAILLSKLRHPNVVHVYDAGITDDNRFIYIVMELLPGRTLRQTLEAHDYLSLPEALRVAVQVADGVSAAHARNAVHRDLKPENVFVEPGNIVKVLDFGVAKFLGYGVDTTDKYRWQGTPLYMSPEQLKGEPVDARSDVYALGTILYEAISGKHPCLNGTQHPTFEEIGWTQILHVPPPLERVVPGVPAYISELARRATAKAPGDRFESMHAFSTALRDAEDRLLRESRARGLEPALRELCGTVAASSAPIDATDRTEPDASVLIAPGVGFETSGSERRGSQAPCADLGPRSNPPSSDAEPARKSLAPATHTPSKRLSKPPNRRFAARALLVAVAIAVPAAIVIVAEAAKKRATQPSAIETAGAAQHIEEPLANPGAPPAANVEAPKPETDVPAPALSTAPNAESAASALPAADVPNAVVASAFPAVSGPRVAVPRAGGAASNGKAASAFNPSRLPGSGLSDPAEDHPAPRQRAGFRGHSGPSGTEAQGSKQPEPALPGPGL